MRVATYAMARPSGETRGSPTSTKAPMSAGWKNVTEPACSLRLRRTTRPVGAEDGLGRSQPCDRHPEGRAAYVIETDRVEELDRLGIAAVLAANAEFQIGLHGPALARGQPHQDAHPALIERLERVALQQSLLKVGGHHAAFD